MTPPSPAPRPQDVDWQAFFFNENAPLPARLMARAQRRFGDSPDAQAAYNYALAAVAEDGWARLRASFKGLGSPLGFLAVTFNNFMEEYAVKKYGRRRAPAWVRRLGGYWPRLFDLLCLRRLLPENVVDMLCAQHPVRRDEIAAAIREVRGRIPDCGRYVGEHPASEVGDLPEPRAPAADEQMDDEQWRMLTGALQAVFEDGRDARSIAASAADAQPPVELSHEERLLLKLVYQDGFSVAKAARTLSIHEQTARRRHKALLVRLRTVVSGLEA